MPLPNYDFGWEHSQPLEKVPRFDWEEISAFGYSKGLHDAVDRHGLDARRYIECIKQLD